MESSEERKLVTVLFADLAGSTELATRHDPEQLRGLLSAFFEEMAQQVRVFGGTVEKYAGDAIMAVFGVPHVHEDDAERAVRAAVAMRESLAQLNPIFEQEYGIQLALRVGIATGEAVASTRDAREFMVTGEVANLAARLQAAAPGILVSEETHRLVVPLVESARLPPLSLKGFPAPVTAYAVATIRPAESRPRGIPGLMSPVVGRDAEVAALREAVGHLQEGRGQIGSITGEAGIGKSRLKNELRENLPEGVRWLEGRCQAYSQTTSYGPLLQILKTVLQLGGGESQTVARTRLRVALRSLVGERYEQVHPALAQLLGVEAEPGRHDAGAMDPQALQSQLVLAMRAVVEGLAGRTPLILAVEDLHWADPATIEILTVLSELTDLLPLMILVTSRPDPEGASWDFRFHAQRNYRHRLTELTLGPLSTEQSARLVGNLLHIAELPAALRSRILEQAEGNPFFVEEIIRTLIEEGAIRREGDRWTTTEGVAHFAIPATLRGVIAARIDRLPAPAKTLLQHASIIGRFFGYRALAALDGGGAELDRSLAQLLRAELIREWTRLPERQYLFKHALTQEAAYASILAADRRTFHRTLAFHLEEVPASAGEQVALLAHHWLRAENWERALVYTLEVATRAGKLYARPEAITHYWQALALLEKLPPTFERGQTYVDVVLSLQRLPGWMRDEAGRADGLRHIDAALRIAAGNGDQARIARLEAIQGLYRGDDDLFRDAIARAEASGDALTLARVTREFGGYLGIRGRYEEAMAHIRRAIGLLAAQQERFEHGLIMVAEGRCYSSRAGNLQQALGYASEGHEIAEALGDARLRAWGAMEAEPYFYKGLWPDVVRVAEAAQPVGWEIGEWNAILWSSGWLGIAYLKLGRSEDARRVLQRALREVPTRAVDSFPITYPQIALAQLHLADGDAAQALAAARKALELADGSRLRLEQGAARRVLGQVHEAAGDRAQAATEFRGSLDILEEIQSRPELAQTLIAYGRFMLTDDPAGGRDLIHRALGLFESMGATGWAAEARAALGG